MSRAVEKALRRARVRALTRGAERRARPETTTEEAGALEGPQDAPKRRVKPVELELTPPELEALQGLATRHQWARMLLEAHLEDELTELTVWNARSELEDELGEAWPMRRRRLEGTLGQKLTQLFNSTG